MSVNGTFTLEKNENIEPFMKMLGLKDEKIQKISAAKPTATYCLSADKLEVTTKGEETYHNTIVLGTPSKFTLATGFEIEVNFSMTGSCGKGTLKHGPHSGEITMEFTETHLTVVFSAGGNCCKRIYKRV